MRFLAGEAPLPTPGADLFGFLPKPIAVVIAVVLAIAYAIGEVSGKLNGPVSKLLARRTERRSEQVVGWRERDRRVEELTQTVDILKNQIGLLREQVSSQRDELLMVHRLSDAQARAIRRHLDWDREWTQRARDSGLDIPDPPPSLYVDLDEHGEERP